MSATDHYIEPHLAALLHQQQRDDHASWAGVERHLEAACAPGIPDLFKGAVGTMFRPIEAGVQDRILSYLNAPSLEAWLELRSVLITPTTTLWQAWIKVDPLAPRVGKDGPHPAPDELIKAIRSAVDELREWVRARLRENPDPGPRLRLVK